MESHHENNFSLEQQPQSTLVQSFWHGKSLQKAYKEGKPSPNSMNDKIASTRHDETSLSRNVHQLICESFEQLVAASTIRRIPSRECTFIRAELESLAIWRKVRRALGEDMINNTSDCDFHEAVRRLSPVCQAIHEELISLEQYQFEERYKESLQWTGCYNRFLDCFSLTKSSNSVDHILCLLLLTSSLEHALGDVYLSYSGTSQCPSLLKDLLATHELKEVFGDAVISLLHILIGPPSSLNLRNVLWHGFASPGEVPVQYASLLLVITASLSRKLEDVPFCSRKMKRRPLLRLSTCAGEQNSIFLPLETQHMPEIFELFHSSFFIIPSMLPLWLQALDYFIQKRFDLCIVLLLPQLEHGLRRVFACVNNCPHRALTAESTVLYTTFDEILSPVLQDGSENLFRHEIGCEHLEMLLDILVHPEGPRIRDHISHGEVDLLEIPQESANHILCICIAFVGLYIYPDKIHDRDNDPFPVTSRICEAAKAYKSAFHPISLLKKTICEVALSFLKWHDLPKPSGEEFDSLESSADELTDQFTDVNKAYQALMASASLPVDDICKMSPCQLDLEQINAFVHVIVQILDVGSFPTLFRPKAEMEVVLLLRSITQHELLISKQVCEAATVRYEQWKGRQLRQRQRANYKRLWTQMPTIFATLQLMVIVVIAELFELPKSTQQRDRTALIRTANHKIQIFPLPQSLPAITRQPRSLVTRFLKRCLQCSENMESLSSMSKNRWDECSAAGKALAETVEHHYSKHRQIIS